MNLPSSSEVPLGRVFTKQTRSPWIGVCQLTSPALLQGFSVVAQAEVISTNVRIAIHPKTLSLSTDASYPNGARERTRTSTGVTHWLLRPACLPIPPREHRNTGYPNAYHKPITGRSAWACFSDFRCSLTAGASERSDHRHQVTL